MSLDPSHKARLTMRLADRFSGSSLFDAVGRAVCEAGCLPRKELYESWEMARRVRRRMRGGRVVELAAGHGLLAHLLLLLDDGSPSALCIDRRRPPGASRISRAMVSRWPRLDGRLTYLERAVASSDDAEAVGLGPGDLVVSAHACGALTDRVLDLALEARARVAVLPCCHSLRASDSGSLEGWMPAELAIDASRAARLGAAGYRIFTLRIPKEITPKNRLLLGEPTSR